MALRVVQTLGKHTEEYSNLSNLVAEMCQKNENESLNNAEIERIRNTNFSQELEFKEDPKQFVLDSKKAFKLFISGLNDDMRFDQLITQVPHNPTSFPYQMGEGKVDVGPLQKTTDVRVTATST